MSQHITDELRRFVASRSDFLCEYCLIHEEDTFWGCQIDYIDSVKNGGRSEPDNLVSVCVFCRRGKNADIGSLLGRTGELVRVFDPRQDEWSDHFYLEELVIKPRTHIGEVTVEILKFNSVERILERRTLNQVGRFPAAAALSRMKHK